MKLLKVIPVILVPLLFSCASTKQYGSLDKPENESKVYIIRKSFMGYPYASKIFVNDKPFGKLGVRNYLSFTPEHSKVKLTSKLENKSNLSLDIEKGKTYYVKQRIRLGWILGLRTKLELMTEEEGKKALASITKAGRR